ncbi:MAG: ribosome-associated translation inhibitor RaiA [Calditrichaceae bacterium]|jgi:putative sigma-54 modulation protein
MNIAITTRGYKAPDRLKSYIIEKLKRLDRFTERILHIEAILSYENLDQVVEFQLRLNNKKIIIKEKSDDVFKSIDLAIDSLERQVTKVKDKLKEHNNKKIVEKLEI